VLEVGLGHGSESEQLIRRGATWSGLDVTPEGVDRVRTRLTLRELPYRDLQVGSGTAIPSASDLFLIFVCSDSSVRTPTDRIIHTRRFTILRTCAETSSFSKYCPRETSPVEWLPRPRSAVPGW
jgi:hypothetical protein